MISISCSPKKTYYENLSKMWKSDHQINPSSLVIQDESIYCHTDSTILKMNLSDGNIVWEIENQGSYLNSKPLFIRGDIYFAGRNVLQKVSTEGEIVWKINTGQKTFGLTNYQNLIINCRTNQGLFANDMKTGKEVWSLEPSYQLLSPTQPVISEDLLLIGNLGSKPNAKRGISCIDLNNQSEVWSYTDEIFSNYGQPITDSNFVYVNVMNSYKDGYTIKLNKRTGKLIWRVKTEPETKITPLMKDNIIYISSYKDGVKALDVDSGEVMFSGTNIENQSQTDLVYHDNSIIYGSQKRELLALDKNGELNIISKFEYGIGNPVKNGKTLYVMDGNSTLSKISSY